MEGGGGMRASRWRLPKVSYHLPALMESDGI